MRVAISQLVGRDGEAPAAHACRPATPARLMALARYLLKTLDGIDWPAIATVMRSNRAGRFTTADLGANVDCTPEQQFSALLGSGGGGAGRATVACLNIGAEAIKGSDTIKQAGELLRAAADGGQINFHGNVEGNASSPHHRCATCSAGNKLLGGRGWRDDDQRIHPPGVHPQPGHQAGGPDRAAGAAQLPAPRRSARLQRRPRQGLRGLVFKSHGSADAFAFEQALARAYDAARNRLTDRVRDRIALAAPHDEVAAAGNVQAA